MHILIIDDHPLYCEALAEHLQAFLSPLRVYESHSLEDALRIMQYKQFDLVCLDLFLPNKSGLEGYHLLRKVLPEAFIVIISGSDDVLLAQQVMADGANGYITKTAGGRELQNALTLILAGELYISPNVLLSSSSLIQDQNPFLPSFTTLTPKQLQVFKLMAKGLSNKSIALTLNRSEGTVKLHVSAILRAMKVCNRTEAVQAGSGFLEQK